MNWNFDRAREAIASLGLVAGNRDVAQYWLTLWHDDAPPLRAGFNPRSIAPHLASIAIMDVVPGETLRCVLAGDHWRILWGREFGRRELEEAGPVETRQRRLERAGRIACGAVMFKRRLVRRYGDVFDTADEIYLPFADSDAHGARRFIVHTNWLPEPAAEFFEPGEPRIALGLARDRIELSLIAA